MSHANLLVILKKDEDLDEVLAPYDENNAEYFEFEDQTEDLLKVYKDEIENGAKEGKTAKEVLDDCGYVEREGRFGIEGNPKGYWDWWVIGGRWESYLKLNKELRDLAAVSELSEDGTHCSICRRKDFDYEGQKKDQEDAPLFFAIVKDGEWYGSADLGWFGTTSNEQQGWAATEERLLKECDPEDLLVLVDYHI